MLVMLFCALLFWVIWKAFVVGIRIAWGITRFFCAMFLPVIALVGIICLGLISIVLPILVLTFIVVIMICVLNA